jgi:hypothetical protein
MEWVIFRLETPPASMLARPVEFNEAHWHQALRNSNSSARPNSLSPLICSARFQCRSSAFADFGQIVFADLAVRDGESWSAWHQPTMLSLSFSLV